MNTEAKILVRLWTALVLILMATGALVRIYQFGLSCPDWPLCFGQVIPDFHIGVWFEFGHRAYAGIIGVLFVFLIWRVWHLSQDPQVRWTLVLAGVFLLIQILYGALTVLLLVNESVVATHLTIASFIVGFMVWVDRCLTRPRNFAGRIPKTMKVTIALIPVLVIIQIFLGGMVAASYTGLICVDWPLCNGQIVPTWQGALGLQVIHRFMAYGLFLIAGILYLFARSNICALKEVVTITKIFFLLIILQIVVGVLSLYLLIPVPIAVLHHFLAVVIFATSINLTYRTTMG